MPLYVSIWNFHDIFSNVKMSARKIYIRFSEKDLYQIRGFLFTLQDLQSLSDTLADGCPGAARDALSAGPWPSSDQPRLPGGQQEAGWHLPHSASSGSFQLSLQWISENIKVGKILIQSEKNISFMDEIWAWCWFFNGHWVMRWTYILAVSACITLCLNTLTSNKAIFLFFLTFDFIFIPKLKQTAKLELF